MILNTSIPPSARPDGARLVVHARAAVIVADTLRRWIAGA
jgi:hypothetical protein